MRKDEKGVHSLDPQWKDQKEQTEIVLPLKVGQTWKRSNGPHTLSESVVALESVTINGKTYEDCYRIRTKSSDGHSSEEYWEAPAFGSIKSISKSGGAVIGVTLRKFKSGKP